MAIPKVVKVALEYEEEGLKFYLKMAKKTKHPLGKKLFYSLAKEEIDHILKFESISLSLKKDGKWPRLRIKGASEVESSIKEFFITIDKKVRKTVIDNIDGYKMAMEIENKSYDMYNQLSKKAGNENEKKLFTALKQEELKHLEAIENVLFYLTNYEDWIQAEESKTWNWMNT